jgi:hypothetical protein
MGKRKSLSDVTPGTRSSEQDLGENVEQILSNGNQLMMPDREWLSVNFRQ